MVDIRDGQLDARRADPEDCDLVFAMPPGELAAVMYGGAPTELLRFEGDAELARRFVTLFPLPAKVS